MKYLLSIFLLISTQSFARSTLDSKLQDYIRTFNLKPLSGPGEFNKKLFILGREFFFEKNLSGNKNISCADCHHPRTMTVDKLPLSLGEGAVGIEIVNGGRKQEKGKIIPRNSPALFNLHNQPILFWDGRVGVDLVTGKFTTPSDLPKEFPAVLKNALAAQALFPMLSHEEMRGEVGTNEVANAKSNEEAWDLLFQRILSNESYRSSLSELFSGEKLSIAHVARAIAYFQEQAFFAADTNFDRYLKGDLSALTEVQKIGMDIFFSKGQCGKCHRGEHLTDFSFQNIGVPQIGPGKENGDDFGRYSISGNKEDLYAFRVPGLRNVSMTAPFMHDGAFKTLAQVIEHYDDIEGSLRDYSFVNNYKNYFQQISGSLASTNEDKLQNLSRKLSKRLFFEESEEKALVEFLRGGLTERRFLDAEISEDYKTVLRMQLTNSGYDKLAYSIPADAKKIETNYYYFDVLTSEGYRLRELENPTKIYLTENSDETVLTYRKQLFKTSGAESGIIASGTFESEEMIKLIPSDVTPILSSNKDFFERLYNYNNEQTTQEIPILEKEIMKNDVLFMNAFWQKVGFKNIETMSDDLNISVKDLFFAPTSSNSKLETKWKVIINGILSEVNLQRSILRTQTGGVTTTWAIELKSNKVSKKDTVSLMSQWLKDLKELDVSPEDAQGSTPSPSKLTEKVLLDLIK
jgi:cytochrome c peroxidase